MRIDHSVINNPSAFCTTYIDSEYQGQLYRTIGNVGINHFFANAPLSGESGEHEVQTMTLFITGTDEEVEQLDSLSRISLKKRIKSLNAGPALRRIIRLDQADFDMLKNTLSSEMKSREIQSDTFDKSTVNAIEHIISDCARQGVSDLHIELPYGQANSSSMPCNLLVRYQRERYTLLSVNAKEGEQFLRILWTGGDNLTNPEFIKDQNNDWKNTVKSTLEEDTQIVIRYNQLPADNLLSATLRLAKRDSGLHQEHVYADIHNFGFSESQARAIEHQMLLNTGLVVLVGQTCSGKTTTADQLLVYKYLKSSHKPKFMTLEDPIELTRNFLLPIDIRPRIGEDGKKEDRALPVRDILRQDGDEVFIGEIRDKDGGDIAFQVYNSGNHSLTTMHTTGPVAAMQKLITIGGWNEEDVFNHEAVRAIVYQRLNPVVCPKCSFNWEEAEKNIPNFSANKDLHDFFLHSGMSHIRSKLRFTNPAGCDHCRANMKTLRPKKGLEVTVGRSGNIKPTICAEVLVSTPELFKEFRNLGIRSGEHYYKTAYRILGHGSYVALSSDQHAAHKVFQGLIDPMFFQSGHMTWKRFKEEEEQIGFEISNFLITNNLSLPEPYGKVFPWVEYINDPEIIVPMQDAVRAQRLRNIVGINLTAQEEAAIREYA